VVLSPQSADPAKGYWLSLGTDGHWALKAFTRTLAEGQTEFRPGTWHKLELRFAGGRITGIADHVELASVDDWTYSRGQAGLGTGWNEALFDNFLVQPLTGPEPPELEVYEAQGEGKRRIGAEAEWFRGLLAFPYTNRLDELPLAPPYAGACYPFSFTYNGQPSDTLLPVWSTTSGSNDLGGGVTTSWRAWTDPATGLRVHFESRCHQGFPDCDWLLYFENTGSRDTPVIESIQALDLTVASPLKGDASYRLHRTKGAPADPTDFEPAIVPLKVGQTERLSAGGGRSSNRDFPFFKVETGEGSLIIAVGWSGQWAAALNSPDRYHLRVTAGQEQTHFILHPGERVRSPRMLLFLHRGDTWEANARFRQLIYRWTISSPSSKGSWRCPVSGFTGRTSTWTRSTTGGTTTHRTGRASPRCTISRAFMPIGTASRPRGRMVCVRNAPAVADGSTSKPSSGCRCTRKAITGSTTRWIRPAFGV
jgi:hypothetical protein